MTPKRLTIWIVEDDALYAGVIKLIIDKSTALRCEQVFQTIEALEEHLKSMFLSIAPDVILLDIQMGEGKSGLDAIPVIHAAMPGTPVVMLTQHEEEKYVHSALQNGAIGYLPKDSGIEEIHEAIHMAAKGGMVFNPAITPHVSSLVKNDQPSFEHDLTERQLEVLRLLSDGMNKSEIADTLQISVNTVISHMKEIYEKLEVNTAQAAVSVAFRRRIIPLDGG